MKTLIGKRKPDRSRIGEFGHSVSVHTAYAGHKVREEFDEVAPNVTAAASKALHVAAHTVAERSRPVRAEAASRGSAALSGLLGEVTPAQIEKISRHKADRAKAASISKARSKFMLLLSIAGGAAIWVLWWKRSGTNWDPRLEEVSQSDPEPVHGHVEGFAGP